ncbi:flotillin family protein [Riemerella anatipestifer]|uniref:flotillin family protein n=1 Tax=Riemerella anatipestifer TaxID=34085 RepID=UPI00208EE4BE|nr:SPFH domain-containing protein [Riemerella anatipestifer]MCO4303456.1 SPFH domain-containing protein [Riemerella anatipestifer]MCO7352415.1 SPFH domain-containing protein [Riemerella anatipestifer]MCQ4038708.1 SPFH domain-containing protein [Riemerella anatipestifer]MCT6760410.1 SPFH domain-containing protein [Riemerella anatipestifer]MCT6764435.1 SPFH domain-containing protein [Riemerella anatipestifer]
MTTFYISIAVIAIATLGLIFWILSMYKKTVQGVVLLRTGYGGAKVFFNAGVVIPIIHRLEQMDISVKKLEIAREGKDGLICKDNMRADIQVAFFVRVNKSVDDIINVGQTIGCQRASDISTLRELFEAKFSEALKTVGKKFDFIELYEARSKFRQEILNIIGTDLNGYVLDDCAIDYLEQTKLEYLNKDNILDSEGIKKITELTASQNIKANLVRREEEKTIKKQDVEAREAILELEKQLAEKEETQKREVENIKARENAEILKVAEEERLKYESVRIATEEALQIAEENKQRQVVIAAKNKERADLVETERVQKDKMLEATERERIVALADIEKDKAVELEKKNIQDVIRERLAKEKTVVEEQQNIYDVEALKSAERDKQVQLIIAAREAEERLIAETKAAEARKLAAEKDAQKYVIEAQAKRDAAEKEAEARKIIADALAKEEATIGLSEAQVMHAKAEASERQGIVDANIIEKKAQAKKIEGLAEADVIKEKALAEAAGITEKAEAMKKLNDAGKEHEEFRLKLAKEKEVELAEINIQKEIAQAQAQVLGEAFKTAKIDIVGGDHSFFDNVVRQISAGKGIDKLIQHSENAQILKESLLDSDSENNLVGKVMQMVEKYKISSEDIKNLSIASLIFKLKGVAEPQEQGLLTRALDVAKHLGIQDKPIR